MQIKLEKMKRIAPKDDGQRDQRRDKKTKTLKRKAARQAKRFIQAA